MKRCFSFKAQFLTIAFFGTSAALLLILTAAPAQAQCVTFEATRDYLAGSGGESVAVGDFDGDGVLDLAVANFNSNDVSVLLGNGDGSFGAARNYMGGLESLTKRYERSRK